MVQERIAKILTFLYGAERAAPLHTQIQQRLARFRPQPAGTGSGGLDQSDAVLITYGNTFRQGPQPPLQTLNAFLRDDAGGLFRNVHILPFYPYSSDDGFSVIDYRAVDPDLGSWEDVAAIGAHTRLMFDAVINHISCQSRWFQEYLQGKPLYKDYFIQPQPADDLSQVVRPRTLPLLTEVQTAAGPASVWTTFSADQIDLNYANPAVLLEILDLLLFYVERGASLIRLDAIAYLWKEPGTTCLHLPQTHAVIRLIRAVLDAAAPDVLLITETNVPHRDNISYFGEADPVTGRTDEAQLVYQFPLAPLTLHAFRAGSAARLSAWAAGLGESGMYFNFLASHDGIGLTPADGLLSLAEIDDLAEAALAHGGKISYRSNPDGSQSAYELNITLFDALNDPNQPDLLEVARFTAAQAIMLSLAGVPGIYVHSLFGSANWLSGMQATGRARTINRAWLDLPDLRAQLADPTSRAARVFSALRRLLAVRAQQPAFHPRGGQRVLDAGPGVFALERCAPGGAGRVLCLISVTAASQQICLPGAAEGESWTDLLDGSLFRADSSGLTVDLAPYQVRWLSAKSG